MKSDYGFDESEKLLNQLEKDVHKQYAQATEEMGKKVDAYFSKFKAEDEKQRAKYEQGEITKKEYTEWRQRKMLTGKRYVAMRDTLAKDLTNTDSIAMRMVGNKMIDTYALNMNYGTYQIEHDLRVDTSFTLYNHDSVERLIKTNPAILPIPKPDKMLDYKWNKQHLQSALTQGILQGEAITKIAKRFQSVSGMDERAAIRNARTAMTGAQNGGRLDAMERAKERGIDVKKAWMATLDNRTRDSHVELDGQEQEIDDEFTNGLMFPGDPEGEPAEVYNCRCRMVHVYGKHPVDWSDTSLRNTDKLGDMTYEEWKEAHGVKIEPKEPEEPKVENNIEFERVTTKQEALESLNKTFTDVDDGVSKLNEQLLVDNVNRFNELNARFGAVREKNGSLFSVNSRKTAVAFVRGGYRDGMCELSLSNKFYKKVDDLIGTYERGQKTFFKMPSTDDYKTTYTITHEYGHILEAIISRKRTDFDELNERIGMYNPAIRGKELNKEEEKHAKIIKDEIIDIAKENNKNFVLDDNLSKYGHTNSFEFFAEVFANSQCGAPNELGTAMEQWLKKEGF